MSVDSSQPVLVTGATGYVAGWIVKGLLDKGHCVHAAVRNPDNKEKLKYLDELAASSSGTIKYFKSDLLKPGSYGEAMEGCGVVFHTASPFKIEVKDPLRELIEPAQMGTRNVLEQANSSDSVKRVVVTSSCAAIYGDNADMSETSGGVFTEEDWNTSSSAKHQPYSYSKTLAEKEAWDIFKKQDQWRLVTINPSLVVGPGINPFGTSESFRLLQQMGDGTFKGGVPAYAIGAVDVREVADAHIKAGFLDDVQGRYILSGHNTDFFSLAKTLEEKFGSYALPRKVLPKWMVWLVAPMINKAMTRKIVSRNIGLPWLADNSKSIRELGIKYRPLKESMEEFFQQLVDNDLV